MKVIALDIATNLGICVGDAGSDPIAWSENLGKPPNEQRFSKLLGIVAVLIRRHTPDLIAYEAPIGGPKTSHYLVGLVAVATAVAANRHVLVMPVDIGSARKSFTGRAWRKKDFPGLGPTKATLAIKERVLEQCKFRKWDVPDHDAADACAVWEYACAIKGFQIKTSGELLNG